jgi:predicted nucleic-acid-binding protein
MIGLDTNVLVRFLVRDDEAQYERARRLIRREAQAGEPVCISLVVLLETEWVLRSRYHLSKAEILGTFSDLLSAVDLTFEDEAAVEEALFVWQDATAQFADCLIGARYRALGSSATATFDAGALKLPGFIAA